MAYKKMKRGWFGESERHRLARLGVKTANNNPVETVMKIPSGMVDKTLDMSAEYRALPQVFGEQYFKMISAQRQNHVATAVRDGEGRVLTPDKAHAVEQDFRRKMDARGIRFDSDWRNDYRSWHVTQFRLTKRQTTSGFSGRKGRYLSWDDWVYVNNTFNEVMDKHDVSANVKSLNGKFVVRRGKEAYTEEDWEAVGYENVGSMVHPVPRKEAWK